MKTIRRRSAFAALLLAAACATARDSVEPGEDYREIAAGLSRMIEHELDSKRIPAISIALVVEGRIVWADGFGLADGSTGAEATARTFYRVGSVSKLFTDIALMQLVERGEVDLDAPIQQYVPELRPENPFGGDITLRRIMAHRSGLVREPPVGHYFDDTEPTLAETVQSLSRTRLVHAPGTTTKYSNAGIAIVGRVIEQLSGEPFDRAVARAVLEPMGLREASFVADATIERRLAVGRMWGYDGREFDQPGFELGMSPAGNLYASALDLGEFMTAIFEGGRGVLKPETLEAMMTPGRDASGDALPFGVGFRIDELDGHRRCGHGGHVYGFAATLSFLPDDGIGVAVLASSDGANAVTSRIGEHALRALLAQREGRRLPEPVLTEPIERDVVHALEGLYHSEGREAELVGRGGRLFLESGALRTEVRALGSELVVDDRRAFGTPIRIGAGGSIEIGDRTYRRVPPPVPAPPPLRWLDLIGEYGSDHNVLFVLERRGRLYALIEWFWFEPLEESAPDTFALPADTGLYAGENIVFERDADGEVTRAIMAGIPFERRTPGAPDGETFKIEPVLPEAELRARAASADPPEEDGHFREPDLVEVNELDSTILLDVRYASTDNFMGMVFYPEERAFLQRPAAEALVRANRSLAEHGFGLMVHDAYRPWHVTKMFWDATPDEMRIFVADPSKGSRHNRGCAVDLTLYELATGMPVETVAGYDEFSERSFPDYPGGTSLQRWYRELLRDAMEEQGFTIYEWEWWHFDYRGWEEYPILDLSFEEILAR